MPLDNRVGVPLLVAKAGDGIYDQGGWSSSWPKGKGV